MGEGKTILYVSASNEEVAENLRSLHTHRPRWSVVHAEGVDHARSLLGKSAGYDLILLDSRLGTPSDLMGDSAALILTLSDPGEPCMKDECIPRNPGYSEWLPYALDAILLSTELRQQKADLEERRDRIDFFAQNAGDILYRIELRPRFHFSYVSPSATDILGYTPEEHYADPDFDLKVIDPEDRSPRAMANFQGDLPEEPLLIRMIRKDGQIIWTEHRLTIFYDESHRPVAFQGIARDVTYRQIAEAKLRQSAAVFESTRDGVTITDLKGTILDVNRAFTEITGFSAEEVVGKNPRVLQSGRHGPDFYRALWDCVLETGSWQGEIWNRRKNGETYPEWLSISTVRDPHGKAINFVGVFTDISRLRQTEDTVERLTHYDPLTNLPNRLLLQSRLNQAIERARRRQTGVALLLIDMDRFKTINEGLGHQIGDALLQQVSKIFASRLGPEDTLARMGGDEFGVLVARSGPARQAGSVAADLLESLQTPLITPDDQSIVLEASVGISLFPDDASDTLEMMRNADAALYRAKAQGRNTYRYHSEELTHSVKERLELENRLRNAVKKGELYLQFQPLFHVKDGRPFGAEALARWTDPVSGPVSPGLFIPIAEESGIISTLGEWALREACSSMQRWIAEGIPIKRIAVNISPRQFLHQDIVALTASILAETGLPPSYLELEITESAVMHDPTQALRTLEALKNLGVSIAIDDFGTGYSSLAYLKRFSIDKLKIDQSFIRDIPNDPEGESITVTIIAMARSLGHSVLAEGVETEAQLEFLKTHGCDSFQGFLRGRPMDQTALAQVFRQSR